MPLSGPRNTPTRDGVDLELTLAATAVIWQGGMVCVDATGLAIAGKTGVDLVVMGVAQASAQASAGDATVSVRPGVYRFGADDQIGQASLGRVVYLVDDETLSATDGDGTRSPAGVIIDIELAGIWVAIGPTVRQA